MKTFFATLLLSGSLVATACSDPSSPVIDVLDASTTSSVQSPGNSELNATLARIRAATSKYHEVSVAEADGYAGGAGRCEASSQGAMGIHYANRQLLGSIPGSNPPTGSDAVIDLLRPEVLLYEPQADGTRRLVGVEYVVFRAAWDAVNAAPPTLLGIPFDQRFGSNTHGLAEHYELHVWLWRNNPSGMFAPYNPKVSCL